MLQSYWNGFLKNPGAQLAVGSALAFLMPAWVEVDIAGVPINVRIVVAIALLIGVTVRSPGRIFRGVNLIDVVLAALTVLHLGVDVYQGRHPFESFAFAYGEWMLPYAVGRYSIGARDDLPKIAPWFVGVGIAISIAAVCESLSGINLWEQIFGEVDDSVTRSRAKRFDLIFRAAGPTRHPIFLAITLMSFLPWCGVLWDARGENLRWRWLGGFGIAGMMVGITATFSRGPILALLLALGLALAVRSKPFRYVGGLLAVGISIFIATNLTSVIRKFDEWTIGKEHARIVEVGEDETILQSGSLNRLRILQVYGPIMMKGGLFGYGSEATEGFPPTGLPYLPKDPEVLERIKVIDNSFLLTGIRFGLLGLVLLLMLFVISIATMIRRSRTASTYLYPLGSLSILAFAATVFACGLEMATVYTDPEVVFPVMMLLGFTTGIEVAASDQGSLAA